MELSYPTTAKAIQHEVAAEWGMTRQEMLFRRKTPENVAARRVAMIRCRADLGMSFPAIGRAFQVHHTTVLHHIGAGKVAKPIAPDDQDTMQATIRKQAEVIQQQAATISSLSKLIGRHFQQESACA